VIPSHGTGAPGEEPASGLKIRGRRARIRENERKQFGRYPNTGFCVQMANWTEGELAELGYALRQYIEAGVSHGKTCSSCGGRFRQRRARQPTSGKRICEACGRPYRAARRWSKYCRPACSMRAYRLRKSGTRASAGV
jgi:hypothetical protein